MSEGVVIVFNRLPWIESEAGRRAWLVINKGINDLKAHALTSMAGAKGGRTYRRGRRVHQASAPGEAPAIDQGDLANSYDAYMESEHSGVVRATVGHAVHTEFGTKKMAARPHMRPALEKVRPIIIEALERVAEV